MFSQKGMRNVYKVEQLKSNKALEVYKGSRKEVRYHESWMEHEMCLASGIKQYLKASYTYIISERVARERADSFKDQRDEIIQLMTGPSEAGGCAGGSWGS